MARLNLSIPDELNNTLAWSAKSLDRSKGYIVRKAIEHYLQEMQEDIEDAEIALQRINAPDFKTCTSEEIRSRLEKITIHPTSSLRGDSKNRRGNPLLVMLNKFAASH